MRRVVVTGLGLVTPLGADVETVWANLLAGKSGAGKITRFDASDQKCLIACEVKSRAKKTRVLGGESGLRPLGVKQWYAVRWYQYRRDTWGRCPADS